MNNSGADYAAPMVGLTSGVNIIPRIFIISTRCPLVFMLNIYPANQAKTIKMIKSTLEWNQFLLQIKGVCSKIKLNS